MKKKHNSIENNQLKRIIAGKKSWKCSVGTVGTAIGGGIAGSSLGPAGFVFGYWGGAGVGAATFC